MEEMILEYSNQKPTFHSYCAKSGIVSNLARDKGFYEPWAEDFFGDAQYNIDNDLGLVDTCPILN